MIRLRITPEGRIRGLWTDAVEFTELGDCTVRRASHVEFDERQQCWTVWPATSGSLLRKWLRRVFSRSVTSVIHRAALRIDALAWEHEHFQSGGRYWSQWSRYFGKHSDRPTSDF
jgi:hypothetical protein